MTLRRMAKATTYLYTSSESYEKLQGGEGGQQRSYQARIVQEEGENGSSVCFVCVPNTPFITTPCSLIK